MHGKPSHSRNFMNLLECPYAQTHVSSPHRLPHICLSRMRVKSQFSKQKLFVLENSLLNFGKYIGLLSEANCHARIPVRPNGGSEPKSGARYYLYYILYTETLIDLFFLRAVPIPVDIQTIFVITKIILHIQKNYHRSGVHHNLYTYTKSHLLIHVQFLLQNIRDCGSSAGEHLSLKWPVLLMWDVLFSSLLFGTYTD